MAKENYLIEGTIFMNKNYKKVKMLAVLLLGGFCFSAYAMNSEEIVQESPYQKLMNSACQNDNDAVTALLAQHPELAKEATSTNQGIDPLRWAAHHGNVDMAKLLLAKGFTLRKSNDGATAFHSAAYEKHHEVLALLLDQADASALTTLLASKAKINHLYLTPYEAACDRINNPCAELLEPSAVQQRIDVRGALAAENAE
ncbi:MAG: ankyrin repeat domain-containing protein [Candidatus Babeliales bacterium]